MNHRVVQFALCLPLLFAAPRSATADQQYHDNVVIVLDASGSMGGGMGRWGGPRKMTAAKQALKTVLQRVPNDTHIGLLVFNQDTASRWTYPLGPRNDAQLNAAIERIRDGGGTPLGEYMRIGADRLLAEREKQFGYGSYRLLVVTDGEAMDSDLMERYTPEIKQRGITLDVIGVAMSSGHTLEKYAHTYRRADDPASLQRAIQEVFAEVSDKDAAGAASEDAFIAIQGIEPVIAQALIGALGKSGDHRIGEPPSAPPSETTSGGSGSGGTAGVPAPSGSHAPTGPAGCSGCVSAGGGYVGLGVWLLLGAFWTAVVMRRRSQRS